VAFYFVVKNWNGELAVIAGDFGDGVRAGAK
jgi:hypothetical protein